MRTIIMSLLLFNCVGCSHFMAQFEPHSPTPGTPEYQAQQDLYYENVRRSFWCGADNYIDGQEACYKQKQAEKAREKENKKELEASLRARYGGKLPDWYKAQLAEEKADRERGEIRIVVDDY